MPSSAKVKVFATFVGVNSSCCANPPIMIDQPEDLAPAIGSFKLSEYERMKDAIADVVDDVKFDMFFHHDAKNIYSFDEKPLRKGAIYGLKYKREDGENEGDRVTAARLTAIQSQVQFEKHVREVATTVFKRPSRPSKKTAKMRNNIQRQQRVDHYRLELCVVMLKDKFSLRKHSKQSTTQPTTASAPPASTIITTNMSSSVLSNMEEETEMTPPIFNESTVNRKRKARTFFKFKARSLDISLHAPIETRHKNDSITTGVPSGKTIISIDYKLEDFIIGDSDSSESNPPSSKSEDQSDEFFSLSFTLPKFRKDLMLLAVKKFPQEYAIDKKALGPKCKLYFKKEWNTSSWSEIASTEDLVRISRIR